MVLLAHRQERAYNRIVLIARLGSRHSGMALPEEEGVEQPVSYINQWISDSFPSIVVVDIVVVIVVGLHLVLLLSSNVVARLLY